jgi:hypothetical protein
VPLHAPATISLLESKSVKFHEMLGRYELWFSEQMRTVCSIEQFGSTLTYERDSLCSWAFEGSTGRIYRSLSQTWTDRDKRGIESLCLEATQMRQHSSNARIGYHGSRVPWYSQTYRHAMEFECDYHNCRYSGGEL